MSPNSDDLSLTQTRILWWMAHTGGEPPVWRDGRAGWASSSHSTVCPHGLGEPYLPHAAVEALIKAGLVALEPADVATTVVAFPAREWTDGQKRHQAHLRATGQPTMERPKRRLLLTDAGRDAAPGHPPYPWRPHANGMRDVTLDEFARLHKVAQQPARAARPKPIDPEEGPRPIPGGANVVVLASRK